MIQLAINCLVLYNLIWWADRDQLLWNVISRSGSQDRIWADRERSVSGIGPWFPALPGHQQPWYWLCKLGRSLSYMRKHFNFLYQFIMSMWKNDGNGKFIFIFLLKNLAHEELTDVFMTSFIKCSHVATSPGHVVKQCPYACHKD